MNEHWTLKLGARVRIAADWIIAFGELGTVEHITAGGDYIVRLPAGDTCAFTADELLDPDAPFEAEGDIDDLEDA